MTTGVAPGMGVEYRLPPALRDLEVTLVFAEYEIFGPVIGPARICSLCDAILYIIISYLSIWDHRALSKGRRKGANYETRTHPFIFPHQLH